MKYLVANWKANKTVPEAISWFRQVSSIKNQVSRNFKIIIAVPLTILASLKKISPPFRLAAQNLSPFPSGPYTGEISAEMLKDLVDYVIVGHSERRRYFGETNEVVVKKVKMALQSKITPIVCLDEPYLQSQIHQLTNVPIHQFIFAYEPLSAIGSGKPDTPENANRVAREIKKITNKAPVLYGGSVDSKNAKEFMLEGNIDGLLVGNASLKTREFIKIVQAVRLIEQ